MDFNIPEEIKLIQQTVRKFVAKELEPISRQVDEDAKIPDHIVEKMKELGLFGLTIPEEYGGMGLSSLAEVIVYEELSKTNACFRSRIGTSSGIGSMGIVFDGTEDQKRKYLPLIASGQWTAAFALTEPDAGSDAGSIKTSARLENEHWVLNGRKHFITNADSAHVFTTLAVTDKKKGARGGITAFIVKRDMPGFWVGAGEKKMGLRGSEVCELVFEDCQVPMENVIGGQDMIGHGFELAMRVLENGRLAIAAAALGASQRLLEIATEYAGMRTQFGKPIGRFQMVQGMLADMATEIFAARSMLYHAAWLEGQRKRVTRESSMAKLFCTEVAGRTADRALQIHGGMGYMKELPLEMFYRDVRLFRIFEGTSEIQRLIIAKDLLNN
jgi:acyl-CoA dehydrogenase